MDKNIVMEAVEKNSSPSIYLYLNPRIEFQKHDILNPSCLSPSTQMLLGELIL